MPPSPLRAILTGGLIVGTLDILDALVFFGLRGAHPIRIFQSIAGGVLGRATFDGGWASAVLGGVLHFTIATTIVAVFYLASARVPGLLRRPVLTGFGYGLAVYAVMNFVVVPLSRATHARWSLPVVINGVCAHLFLVGLPSALITAAARRARAPARG